MNEHDRAQELISRMLDEPLPSEEQNALALHLKECPDCAAVYAAFSALSESLGSDLEEPPASLRENVMAQIRREEIRKRNTSGTRWGRWLSAAAVLVLVIAALPRLLASGRADLRADAAGAYRQEAAAVSAEAAAVCEEATAPAEMPAMENAAASVSGKSATRSLPTQGDAVYDMSARLSLEDLKDFLDGTEEGSVSGLTAERSLCRVLTSDGEAAVYQDDAGLICLLPDGSALRSECAAEELLAWLQG